MKLIESVGLSRSGHHAIINWVIYNLFGFQVQWNYKMTFVKPVELYILDEANHDKLLSYQYMDEYLQFIKVLMVCYEDSEWDFTLFRQDEKYQGIYSLNYKENYQINYVNRFIVIRDFYDNLISRITSNEKKMGKFFGTDVDFLFDIDENYIKKWKNLAKACVEKTVPFIKFEDWLSNEKIKINFLKDTFNVYQIKNTREIVGTKSSFGNNTTKTKYDLTKIPENIKDLIKNDNELHYLMGALGYEYRKL